jgi:hypothetical protein
MSALQITRHATLVALFMVAPAQADPVRDWNLIAAHIVSQSGQGPAQAARNMAMVNAAMFEAVNFVAARYPSRVLVVPAQPLQMSRAVVAAAAAHQVLATLYPGERPRLDDLLQATPVEMPDRHNRASAIIQGRAIADNVNALRASIAPEFGAVRTAAGEDPLALIAAVSEFAAARSLDLLESARLHALFSEAISRAYAGAPTSLAVSSPARAR